MHIDTRKAPALLKKKNISLFFTNRLSMTKLQATLDYHFFY